VQGLPLDVTVDEMVEFFRKAGIIAKDPYDCMAQRDCRGIAGE
jgi:hypothetical protein